jgi:hypothetical protein
MTHVALFTGDLGLDLSKEEVVEELQRIRGRRRTKDLLINRLQSDHSRLLYQMPQKDQVLRESRLAVRENLLNRRLRQDADPAELKYVLWIIRTLATDQIDTDYLCGLLSVWWERYYDDEGIDLAHELRKAICYIDYKLYGENSDE